MSVRPDRKPTMARCSGTWLGSADTTMLIAVAAVDWQPLRGDQGTNLGARQISREGFRDWLAGGHAGKYGLEFLTGRAYRLDPVHVQQAMDDNRVFHKDSPAAAAPSRNPGPITPARANISGGESRPRTLQGYGHPGVPKGASLRDRARAGRGEEDGGGSAVDDARRARSELERPIKVNMDMGGATQFGRASMRREADREVREARFSSTMDIGAA